MKDPIKSEMLRSLRLEFGREDGWKDEAEIAIYYFAEHNHSGQWSNLYSALSRSDYQPGPFTTWDSVDKECGIVSIMYEFLTEKFGEKNA